MLIPLGPSTRVPDVVPPPLFSQAQLALVQYGRAIGLEVFPLEANLVFTERLPIGGMALLTDGRRRVVMIEFQSDGANKACRKVRGSAAWDSITLILVQVLLHSPQARRASETCYTPWRGMLGSGPRSVLTVAHANEHHMCVVNTFNSASLHLGDDTVTLRNVAAMPLTGLDDIWPQVA